MKMKNFCSAKTLVNGEINSKLEENICKPQATKNLSKIFKELLTFKNKQTYNLIKKNCEEKDDWIIRQGSLRGKKK